MQASPQRVILVLNPISGDTEKEACIAQIKTFAQQHWSDYHIYTTSGDGDEEALRQLIEERQPDMVVAVGGDGTVNMVGTLLVGKEVTLGIIPMGSGNGLSKDLGIPQDLDEAIAVLASGQPRPIDTLEINGQTSLHLSDLGFNALIVKRFDEGDQRGPMAYAWNTVKEYMDYEPAHYEVITPDEHYKGRAFMVTIANANMFGSNATINPEGKVDDGQFEVCILEEFPKAAGIGILYHMYRDSIDESVYTKVITCREARILNPDGSQFQIDGEVVGTPAEINVNIRHASLSVMLPLEQVRRSTRRKASVDKPAR
ncbi:lipid kinase, YegS/Rv2252/BmrU family [Catalinimonas alkaloidigena]|uniref:Lipid kinase, YegS/Rv2252/BmrU family n=1 Tax=Catalinimonas alkaloidigena TaxID=1075417 RepID=A0A1G9H6E2_9BACT|nr:diacylglycerol kinase family protein [Catalinimonas alkaloidigena]SDL08439.1 lipid kinase, YegS/Rv2252/BmrU family [Catalinimonas alkaloidigena]